MLALAAVSAWLAVGGGTEPLARPALLGNPSFGVAFAHPGGPEVVRAQLAAVGAGSWYTYALPPGEDWAPGRALLLRTGKGTPRYRDDAIAAAARARPGSAWLIGNEPNIPGQDELDGAAYAAELERYRLIIKAADPAAVLVAPNVQNLYAPCVGCQGAVLGVDFLDAWRAAHRARFGGEPRIDAFGLHLYDVNWERLPMTDHDASLRELEAARRYVDSVPAWRDRPLWVTEYGVIWGFPDYAHRDLPDGSTRLAPVGALDDGALLAYLDELTRYFQANATRLRLERWFVFANARYAEPYADAPAGIALFEAPAADAGLTAAGRRYRELAAR